ncbi:MAG TPA: LLM class flavin-dependent oxidoreductase [Acidimicrobiia bacterium]|nr:LLM class flavin-dependent oxidoreductase [Acidimicrobiia bacterium]
MKIGASLRSTYMPPDVRTGARWMVERARAAAAAGLDSLFVGDHHAVPVPYYQNVAIMGRLLAEWDSRPAGVLMLLPLWQPVLAAEQIGTLASIAQGPFILQCAVGGGDAQFAAMGASMRDRGARFESTLETVRRLCAGEVVDGVKIAPVPPEPLQVWVGASAPKAVDRAARVADAFLIGPEATPAQIDDLVRMYRNARATHDRDEGVVAVRRDIHVGKDDDDAQRVAGPVIDAGYRGFDPSAPIVGGPETVARAFKALKEKGCTEVVVRHLAEDQSEVLLSYERLATVKQLLA